MNANVVLRQYTFGCRPTREDGAVNIDRCSVHESWWPRGIDRPCERSMRMHEAGLDPRPPEPEHTCSSCDFLGPQRQTPMKATRLIAGVWYCFAHGMDIYCD